MATHSPQGSLALAEGDPGILHPLDELTWEKRAMHSELATVNLTTLLVRNGRTLKDLTHIAVVLGPGSFTGIRVGVNLARTLAYALKIPVAGLSALLFLAHRHLRDDQTGLVAVRAVREFYYAGLFRREHGLTREICQPFSATRETLVRGLDAGTAILVEGETKDLSLSFTASDLALGLTGLHPHFLSWSELKPLYIRASEAEEKMRQSRSKPV